MNGPAVTWWGHSSMSVELGSATVATDPLLTTRLYHLRSSAPMPPPQAAVADVVLVSPPQRFHRAAAAAGLEARILTPNVGERAALRQEATA